MSLKTSAIPLLQQSASDAHVCYNPLLYVMSTAILQAQIRETAECCVSCCVFLQGTCRKNIPSNRKRVFPVGGEMFDGVTIPDAYKLNTNKTDLLNDNAKLKLERVLYTVLSCYS
jgi:hypothetical protein